MRIWAAGGAVMAAVAAIVASAAENEQKDARRGRSLVETNCATCHAIRKEGESPVKAALPFRDLHKRYPVENLAEALAEGITSGHANMPEFKFQPKQVDEIIDYLKTLER